MNLTPCAAALHCFLQKLAAFTLCLLLALPAWARESYSVTGIVKDRTGAAVADAAVSLLTAQRAIISTTTTDAEGRFTIAEVGSGTYLLKVVLRGFEESNTAITVRQANVENVEVTLEVGVLTEQVTITTNFGAVESIEAISQQVNLISEREIQERAKSIVAQVAVEEPGIHLQRTSTSLSGIFVRGLTGNKVNVFIDGVRYSTAAQRGGVSTFLNLIEPANLQGVEVIRGPNSAQYGSDSLGGSIQFLTRVPSFSPDGFKLNGSAGVYFNSADTGFGSNVSTVFSTRNFGLLTSVAGRRVNTLRTGDGIDSHSALTRFLGLSSEVLIDDRMPDTGFTQYGGQVKMNWSPAPNHQVIANYTRSQQDGGKRFDQLLGGDGNLIAELENLMLDFFYLRYDKFKLGWFDNLSLLYSFNGQREERVNQGGNGNPLASITHEPERLNANGLQGFVSKLIGTRNNLLIGGDYQHERIDAPSFSVNPITRIATLRRGRVPDNARYERGGVFIQDLFEAIPNKLRLIGNLRYNAASYEARAEDSPIVGGRRLWPSDSLKVDNVTFRAGVVATPVEGLHFLFNVGRGFRAPHLTDLDGLGLTGSGFEVTAAEVAGLGATVGTAADDTAISSGRPVEQVTSEYNYTYDFGVRYHNRRVDTDFAFFINDIYDNITKQALILPAGAVGRRLSDQTIIAQTPDGAVFVAAATNPVLVRANFDDARIYGFEHTFDAHITSEWDVSTVFTYLHARDKRTDLPPNIEGGTPAPEGYLKVRYAPTGKRFWLEPYVHIADRQERLSTLDLADRRTGARRTRNSIAAFFANGARVRGLISPGADSVFGTPDDILKPTGETLAQVQNRVLGVGVNAASLFTAIPGYVTFNLRGGFRFGDRHEVLFDFENIGDRNYRGLSWGIDAPGRGIFLRYNTRF